MAFTTRLSMLQKVGNNDEAAWNAFVDYYTPLIRLRAQDMKLTEQETDDLRQDVCVAMFKSSAVARYDKSQGSFRNYLRTIITNCAIDILRKRESPVDITTIDDPPVEEDDRFEQEWRKFLYEKALEEVRANCDPATYMAFELYAIRGLPVQTVAEMVSLKEASVYQAKTRITQRLTDIIARLQREHEG